MSKSVNFGKKKLEIDACCNCPFNDHGQEDRIPIMETYLGVSFRVYGTTRLGGPQLECWYRPDVSLRDNFRGYRHTKIHFIIWQSSNPRLKGEFERQLNGFPKRCPLEEA